MANTFSQLPQNIDAEQSVLSAILIDNSHFGIANEILSPEDFYSSKHQKIFLVMQEMFTEDKPIDLVILAEELTQKKELDSVGGASYLANLINNVPLAINIKAYAEIVKEKSIARELITAGELIIKKAYDNADSSEELCNLAETAIFEATERGVRKNFIPLKATLVDVIELIERRQRQKSLITGLATGYHKLDMMTAGLQSTDLIVLAARPSMGKTALALNIARNISQEAAVAFFSLEMADDQLTMRLLAAESKTDSSKLKRGFLQKENWRDINKATCQLSELNFDIDDNPDVTFTNLKSRILRLKKEKDVKIVFIDYLQLMTSQRRHENKVAEVSALTRNLKKLAKNEKIVIILLSQLNRKVEERSDRRPILSDLRDSGCLAGDTLVFSRGLKEFKKMESLATGRNLGYIDSLSLKTKKEKFVVSNAKRCFSTGQKQFYKIVCTTGHTIEATENHKFLVAGGQWLPLSALDKDSMIGLPLNFLKHTKQTISSDEIKLLALFVGNGCCLPRRVLQYTSHSLDVDICDEIMKIADIVFNNQLKPRKKKDIYRKGTPRQSSAYQVYFPAKRQVSRSYRNPMVLFFEKHGLYGKRHAEKFIPDIVFQQPLILKRLFIKYLWATDGTVGFYKKKNRKRISISYTSKSKKLIKGLQILLQSIGILSITHKIIHGKHSWYLLSISSRFFMEKFLKEIGCAGQRKQQKVDICLNEIKTLYAGWTKYELSKCHNIVYVPIKEIVKTEIKEAYDIEVSKTHNFIANGIIAHNSVEQDADIVLFIYRQEIYDKDPKYEGKVELIIAKHRNGSIGTVDLTFLKEYTKFEDVD